MSSAAQPFLVSNAARFGVPRFDQVHDSSFVPALRQGMEAQRAEIASIVSTTEPASFENTVLALEESGSLYQRVSNVFDNYRAAHVSPEVERAGAELASEIAAHQLAISQNQDLYQRILAVAESSEYSTLSSEQQQLVKHLLLRSRRCGVALPPAERERVQRLQERLSELLSEFARLSQEARNAALVVVTDESELEGLSEARRDAARSAAVEAGHPHAWAFPLDSTTVQPIMSELRNRSLRERIYQASASRGAGGEHDTRPVIVDIVAVRAEIADVLGYESYAHFATEIQCARTPQAVEELLGGMIPAVTANLERERKVLTELLHADGYEGELQAWDWPYYEAVHLATAHAVDQHEVQQYLELERVLREGVLFAAQQVYGLRFIHNPELPVPHPDARAYEVRNDADEVIGVSILDLYARPSKRGGAWMNFYVAPNASRGVLPVTTVCMNIAKPAPGQLTHLSLDEVVTLFHEFGHNLHGLLAEHAHTGLSMMELPVDFVEFPSQLNEMWALHPDVVPRFAVHPVTGVPMPEELLAKVINAAQVGEGFRMAEYLAAALLDIDLHLVTHHGPHPTVDTLAEFEQNALAQRGMGWPGVAPRYRTTYFGHIFGGYGAGYFAYIWSEMLARDVERWVLEHSELSRATGTQLTETVLRHGAAKEPHDMVLDLLGRQAEVEPLLRKRGLLSTVN